MTNRPDYDGLIERLRKHAEVVAMPCLSAEAADALIQSRKDVERLEAALELIAAPREVVLNVDTGQRRPETDAESASFARRHARATLSSVQGIGKQGGGDA